MANLAQLINEYLELKASLDISNEEKVVSDWVHITVDYIWRLDDENVFDTSVEHIAKAAGKHSPQRDYTEGLGFKVWAWQMIKWFDTWVVWMKLWETKTVLIPASEAYWEHNPDLIVDIDIKHLPPKDWWYVVGDLLYTQTWHRLTISQIVNDTITLDQNHELAGKDLIFDITIKEIK